MSNLAHNEQHGGLMNKSIGPDYPFTIVGIGYEGWQVFHCTRGVYLGPVFENYDDAQDFLNDAKENDE